MNMDSQSQPTGYSEVDPGRSLGDTPESTPLFVWVSLVQGVFYLVTGLWPLFSIETFQKVTGPKVDLWLVKTVGVLIAVIGGVVGRAGLRREVPSDIMLLATGSAAGLTAIDVIYVARRRILPVYLLDAVAEVALIGLWLFIWKRMGSRLSNESGF